MLQEYLYLAMIHLLCNYLELSVLSEGLAEITNYQVEGLDDIMGGADFHRCGP